MFSISRTNRQNNPELTAPPRRTGVADLFILLIVGVVTVVTFPAISSMKAGSVTIFRDNRPVATYPLDTDRIIPVTGVHGPMEITIRDGAVSVTSADCPHGICRKSGSIRNPHSQIVCAPNHILIMITSPGNDTLDAIVR